MNTVTAALRDCGSLICAPFAGAVGWTCKAAPPVRGGGTRTVDVHIRRLREKIPMLNEAIETVKQFGYRLV